MLQAVLSADSDMARACQEYERALAGNTLALLRSARAAHHCI